MSQSVVQTVWIFHGNSAQFACAVFSSLEAGEAWVAKHKLSGLLTELVIDDPVWDRAVRLGHFKPSKGHHGTPEHIVSFTGGEDHHHYFDGSEGSGPPDE